MSVELLKIVLLVKYSSHLLAATAVNHKKQHINHHFQGLNDSSSPSICPFGEKVFIQIPTGQNYH
jgi:hypothetical protein